MKPLVLVGGCGAVGSWLIPSLDETVALLCADRDIIAPENLGVAAFDAAAHLDPQRAQHARRSADPQRSADAQNAADVTDASGASPLLGRKKAEVVAERHRARGGWAYALHGDVRYTLTPGLASRLDAAVVCFDNASAFRDVSEVLWSAARPGIPILAVTCGGGDDEHWQVRLFATGGLCPACMQSPAERQEGTSSTRASCAAAEAPRASARAAEAAGRAGASLLARVMAGERSLVGRRLQRDGREAAPWSVRMPEAAVPGCPIPHGRETWRIEELLQGVDDLTVGALAERARDLAGMDATFVLGRRALPLAGFTCPQCKHASGAPELLLPAAAALARACDCPGVLRPLGERRTITAHELVGGPMRDTSLRAWGASPGDGFLVTGAEATVELRCRLTWEELDRG